MNTLRPLIGRLVVAGLFVCVALCCTPSLFAVTYLPGPAPTCTLTHQTVETIPTPRDRTTIGICEQVTCSITNWSDTDIKIDGETQTNVSDSMGDVTWSATKGTVNPTVASSTTYTAPASDSDTSATVTANVFDSGTEGLDDALQKQVTFSIKIPTGCKPTFNYYYPGPDPGPPNNRIGAAANFFVQVLPDTVNFTWVDFRENKPGDNFAWPDGTANNYAAGTVPFGVSDQTVNNTLIPNVANDIVSTNLDPVARLFDGQTYQNCTFNVRVPLQFSSTSGWITFEPNKVHPRVYTGATLKCHVGIHCGGGNADSTPDRGPWQ